jgi:diadenosine tetraphosphate (Ap4A) HIT family hydrolase
MMPVNPGKTAARAEPGCGICATIAGICAGTVKDFVAELPRSYLILAAEQFYRGYCIMLAKRHVREMFQMPADEARELFEEMRLAAGAIAAVTNPWKMNYACLGNLEPHVHWHLIPRYANDPMRRAPIWRRPDKQTRVALAPADRRALLSALRNQLKVRLPHARLRKS